MLKLYHFWSSTCSRKVRICLAEKELDWQSFHVDIVKNRDNLQEWYLKLNPNGVVPTLDHDVQIVTESNIIIEYLDESFQNKTLKPNDTYERALMRLWMDKAETIVHKILMLSPGINVTCLGCRIILIKSISKFWSNFQIQKNAK